MILLIDNYDSFVHNLARYVRELGRETVVVRNDAITPQDVAAAGFEAVVLSPGPCTPTEAGVCLPLIRSLPLETPLLGICLGHQAIATAFGGRLERTEPVHGQASPVRHAGTDLFAGLPSPFLAARYHSLAVAEPLPRSLRIDAATDDGIIMALSHRTRPVFGVQFHPESVLTEHGYAILENFLQTVDSRRPIRPAPPDRPVAST